MGAKAAVVEGPRVMLRLGPLLDKMTDHDFFEFCRLNRDWRIERTHDGDLIILPPTGGETGRENFNLTKLVADWVEADGTGIGFDSSTGFTLPNGAVRSPDVAWVRRSRWEALTPEERGEFPPLCPDFVIELRSRTDALETLKEKMEEYRANGASLGLLIDPLERRVYVYQPSEEVRVLDNPDSVSGDPVLPGFTLDLRRVWGPTAPARQGG